MVRAMPAAYFRTGVFANTRPGELFQTFTCLACEARLKTWALFRQHREACRVANPPDEAPLDAQVELPVLEALLK
jgi:hypothetical protein